MALFDEQIVTNILTLLQQQQQQLTAALGLEETDAPTQRANAPIAVAVQLLICIANGEISRGEAPRTTVRQGEAALQALHNLLFGTAYGITVPIPNDFWQNDIGILYSRARWWLSGDELITISNAAALAFGENSQANRMRVVRAIDGGLLDSIPDPSVANPQQNRRVLRPQVERWAELRRRPGE